MKKSGINEVLDLARSEEYLYNLFQRKKSINYQSANHQGIVASVAAYKYAELDDLFEVAQRKK